MGNTKHLSDASHSARYWEYIVNKYNCNQPHRVHRLAQLAIISQTLLHSLPKPPGRRQEYDFYHSGDSCAQRPCTCTSWNIGQVVLSL